MNTHSLLDTVRGMAAVAMTVLMMDSEKEEFEAFDEDCEDEDDDYDDEDFILRVLCIRLAMFQLEEDASDIWRAMLDECQAVAETNNYRGSITGRRYVRRYEELGSHGWVQQYLGQLVTNQDGLEVPPVWSGAAVERHNFQNDFGVSFQHYMDIVEEMSRPEHGLGADARSAANKFIPFCVKVLSVLHYVRYAPSSFKSVKTNTGAGTSTMDDFRHRFATAYVAKYKYVISSIPSLEDVQQWQDENAEHGFPGCIGDIDCIKQLYHGCPLEQKGQYQQNKKVYLTMQVASTLGRRIIMGEAGSPGAQNDINIWNGSNLRKTLHEGKWPAPEYEIKVGQDGNGNDIYETFDQLYIRGDGIYGTQKFVQSLRRSVFVNEPQGFAYKFEKRSESVRKSVECLFGVLQREFSVFTRPLRWRTRFRVKDIQDMCMILHNQKIDRGYGAEPICIPSEVWEKLYDARNDQNRTTDIINLFFSKHPELQVHVGENPAALRTRLNQIRGMQGDVLFPPEPQNNFEVGDSPVLAETNPNTWPTCRRIRHALHMHIGYYFDNN